MTLFLTGTARRLEERKKNRIIDMIALKNAVYVRRDIKRYMNGVINHFEQRGSLPDYGSDLEHSVDLTKSISRMYRQSINTFSKYQFDAIQSSYKGIPLEFYETMVIKELPENDYLKSLFHQLSKSWIAQNALKQSTLIAETSKGMIKKILEDSYDQGLMLSETVKRMKKAVPVLSGFRATTISITETHNAATYADLKSTSIYNEEFNLQLMKEWVATEDERTREDHSQADGQKVQVDSVFSVGGETMTRPGDPSARASNIINCRCSLGYARS